MGLFLDLPATDAKIMSSGKPIRLPRAHHSSSKDSVFLDYTLGRIEVRSSVKSSCLCNASLLVPNKKRRRGGCDTCNLVSKERQSFYPKKLLRIVGTKLQNQRPSFTVSLVPNPPPSFVYLNGQLLTSTPSALRHGDKISFVKPPELPAPLTFTFVTSNPTPSPSPNSPSSLSLSTMPAMSSQSKQTLSELSVPLPAYNYSSSMTLSGGLEVPSSTPDFQSCSGSIALKFFSPSSTPSPPVTMFSDLSKEEVGEMELKTAYAKTVAELILNNSTNQQANIFKGCKVGATSKTST